MLNFNVDSKISGIMYFKSQSNTPNHTYAFESRANANKHEMVSLRDIPTTDLLKTARVFFTFYTLFSLYQETHRVCFGI